MSEIVRLELAHEYGLVGIRTSPDGDYMIYTDHLAALAEKENEISDAWCLAFNLWPGDKEPSELNLNAVIYELGERYKREIAALTARVRGLEGALEKIVAEGDYSAPEGMKRIAKAALKE